MVGSRLGSDDSLHVHDRLETVALDEQVILGLLLLPLTDHSSVDGCDSLDDNVWELPLDVSQTEVPTLLVVDVDSDSVVVRDDVDFLRRRRDQDQSRRGGHDESVATDLWLDLELSVADNGPLDLVQGELELI